MYVTLVSSILGLVAVVAMKFLEMYQSKNTTVDKIAPRAPEDANSDAQYGSIQGNDHCILKERGIAMYCCPYS